MRLDKYVNTQPSLVHRAPSSISNKAATTTRQANVVNSYGRTFMDRYEYSRNHAAQYPEEFAAYSAELDHRIQFLSNANVIGV